MNLFAPALCLIAGVRLRGRHVLLFASVLQIALLAFWHMPLLMAHDSPILRVFMHASLICVAFVFWGSVVGSDRRHAIKAIAALLLTGKLVCLVGVILVFAPRPLYLGAGHAHGVDVVGDQQLAGLVMLATCSLTYMSGAIILFWRWLADIRSDTPVRILG
jgi:putative membrane protein